MLIELNLIFLFLQLISISILLRQNYIMILITLELIFLSIILLNINISFILDDTIGAFITLIVLIPTACESAIGLILLINFYNIRGTLTILT